MTISTIEYALMAGASYFDTRNQINRLPFSEYSGWARLSGGLDHRGGTSDSAGSQGFEATAYERGSEIVISFAGTYDFSGDGSADFQLAAGYMNDQLYQAAKYYLDIKRANPNAQITFTGHSLGGGLASLMGVFFNLAATTFDPAPFRPSATPSIRDDLLFRLEDEAYLPVELQELQNFSSSVSVLTDPTVTNIRGESKITYVRVDGEVLGYADGQNVALPAIVYPIGTEATLLTHGDASVSSVDLHSQALLIALKQSENFRQSTYGLSFLLADLFDQNLFAAPTDPSNETDKDFLTNLIRYEFGIPGETGSKLELLTKFGNDTNKLATFSNAGASITEPLLKILMNYYYEKEKPIQVPEAEPSEFFTKLAGGLQFDMNKIAETVTHEVAGYENENAKTGTDLFCRLRSKKCHGRRE